MRPSSRSKLTIVFSLLLIFIVDLTLRGFLHTPAHAANSARTVGLAPCGMWSVVPSPSPSVSNDLYSVYTANISRSRPYNGNVFRRLRTISIFYF